MGRFGHTVLILLLILVLILLPFAGARINVKVEIPTIIYKEVRHGGYINEILYKATVNTVAMSETAVGGFQFSI